MYYILKFSTAVLFIYFIVNLNAVASNPNPSILQLTLEHHLVVEAKNLDNFELNFTHIHLLEGDPTHPSKKTFLGKIQGDCHPYFPLKDLVNQHSTTNNTLIYFLQCWQAGQGLDVSVWKSQNQNQNQIIVKTRETDESIGFGDELPRQIKRIINITNNTIVKVSEQKSPTLNQPDQVSVNTEQNKSNTIATMPTIKPATTPAATPADPQLCSIRLWVIDPDPNGLNIRAQPNGSAKIIGTLPTGTEFTAIKSSNGWIKFKNPVAFAPQQGIDWEPITTGALTGWLHGSMVTTSLRNSWVDQENLDRFTVFEQPTQTSSTVASWTGRQWWSPANDIPAIQKVLACHGGWIKVDLIDGKNTPHTGWIHRDNQCPNQVTTCP
ncbi:MAG: SH3 domain-containing protein [Saccharospirillaceae bacterium]|nr:SH3 domain-containing protein [Pseudomonadales bacterium]NRB78429.1 SH3 domain-containing protein [Saccharospirillaceae bacterium]